VPCGRCCVGVARSSTTRCWSLPRSNATRARLIGSPGTSVPRSPQGPALCIGRLDVSRLSVRQCQHGNACRVSADPEPSEERARRGAHVASLARSSVFEELFWFSHASLRTLDADRHPPRILALIAVTARSCTRQANRRGCSVRPRPLSPRSACRSPGPAPTDPECRRRCRQVPCRSAR
jgi:hypothetical protein